jgi:hypothetical protein
VNDKEKGIGFTEGKLSMRKFIHQLWWFLQRDRKELVMARVFEDTRRRAAWLDDVSFSPHGNAANYSFLYVLSRVLETVSPARILEFGMGQSTILTSYYALRKNPRAHVYVVEHDERWVRFFGNTIARADNVHVVNPSPRTITYRGAPSLWYEDLGGLLPSQAYDCIIVDGPQGSPRYSRVGIMELLPSCLGDSFAIVIDDYERKGERQTVREIFKFLKDRSIPFESSVYEGAKQQCLIYSKDHHFLEGL